MKRTLIVLLTALLCIPALAAAPKIDATHTGTWWLQKSSTFHEAYIVGYFEGAMDARSKLVPSHIKLDPEALSPWVAGLNTFYADFRNRDILVSDALQYVHDQIDGATDKQLAGKLSVLRQAAAARNGGN